MQRRQVNAEKERINHCAALEAAEKRGQEKVMIGK